MSSVAPGKALSEKLDSQLAQATREADRNKVLARHRSLISPEAVKQLAEMVVTRVRVDTREALALADAALAIARKLRQNESVALGLRAKANALYAGGDNRSAVEHHEKAIQLYSSMEIWKEAARTLSSSIQPLILLGEYDRAFQAAERAREIFTRLNEPHRIARLDINAGNIFHRQDRFEEAREMAHEGFLRYEKLCLRYESAKTRANEAIAYGQQG